MTDTERAKSILTKLPDEVFDTWLSPIIESQGWPIDTGFFFPFPLEKFAHLSRYRDILSVEKCPLHPHSKRFIQLAVIYKATDLWTDIIPPFKKTKGSLAWHMTHIERTGKLWAPLVLISTFDGFIVSDGSHRLAALFSMKRDDIPIDAWIAQPP